MICVVEALKPFYLFSISDTSVASYAATRLPITPVFLREEKNPVEVFSAYLRRGTAGEKRSAF